MNLSPIIVSIVSLVASFSFGLEVVVGTGSVQIPGKDGNFSGANIRDAANIFFCITDSTTYQTYVDDSVGLYQTWLDGGFENETYCCSTNTDAIFGESDIIFDVPIEGSFVYAVAIATYFSEEYNCSYYIARAVAHEYKGDDPEFDSMGIPETISGAGRWQVIYNEPPSITCTDLCVTGGVVSATYSISEFSRLNEIVSGEETSVIVAADLARTTQTNLAASVTATNSGESTFTFSFNPAEQNWTNSTLFIFGVESPR